MARYIQVLTTTATKEDAEKIADHLLEKRFAACVQIIGPINSKYWWKGRRETSKEFLCLIKTKKELYPKVEKAIKKMHPYENPEIIAIHIERGSKDYFDWIQKELS